MNAHVFFDNSNIWGGAQAVRKLNEPKSHWAAFRVYYRNLFQLIERGHKVHEALLAGSVPPSCDPLWEYARHHGYSTDLLRRITTEEGAEAEQGVDEILHLKIANCLLDNDPKDSVLILATGDGAESQFGTGFKSQVTRALNHGWQVQIWSWKPTLNRCFGQLAKANANLSINLLDPYYLSITFLQGGTYYLKRKGANVPHPVAERIVAPLT